MNPEEMIQEDGGVIGNMCAAATILIIALLTSLFTLRPADDSPATDVNGRVGEHGDRRQP